MLIGNGESKPAEGVFSVGLIMSVDLPRKKDRVNTTLLGWDLNNFLLLKPRLDNGRVLEVGQGDTCVCRFINDEAYGFKSEVTAFHSSPFPLVAIKYPKVVEFLPFRKVRRFTANIPVEFLNVGKVKCGGAIPCDGSIVDISEGGCLLKTSSVSREDGWRRGDKCFLSFKIIHMNAELYGIIKNMKVASENNCLLGIEFLYPNEEYRKNMLTFLDVLRVH